MSHRLTPLAAVAVLTLAAAGCSGDDAPGPTPAATPESSPGVLLEQADLPDGWSVSPADAAPEVSTASSVSVAGCEVLLDYFRDGAAADGATARFEAGEGGPFLAETVGGDPDLATTAGRCGNFTDTDSDGAATQVRVAAVADFPRLGDQESVFSMSVGGGTGDEAFEMSGYLLVVRVKGTTCTLVHFGQPGVDRAETEMIARTATRKLQR